MSSFSILHSYLLLVNIVVVLAQQQQPNGQQQLQQSLNVHQQSSPSQRQQQQQVQHQEVKASANNDQIVGKNGNNNNQNIQGAESQHQGVPVVGLFSSSYRGPSAGNNAVNQGSGQFVSTQHGYSTYTGYPQESMFNSNSVGLSANSFQPPQLFGLSSNGDFQLSAYFGNIFWTVASGILGLVVVVVLFRTFGGFEKLGNLFANFRDTDDKTGPSGRAIDLDKLSTMVYNAFDQYGRWKNSVKDKKTF